MRIVLAREASKYMGEIQSEIKEEESVVAVVEEVVEEEEGIQEWKGEGGRGGRGGRAAGELPWNQPLRERRILSCGEKKRGGGMS